MSNELEFMPWKEFEKKDKKNNKPIGYFAIGTTNQCIEFLSTQMCHMLFSYFTLPITSIPPYT